MSEDCNTTSSLEVTGPGGIGAKVRSTRMSDIIALLSVVALGIMGHTIFAMHGTMASVSQSIRELAAAQRESTCILSRPQDERPLEYSSPTSVCKMVGRVQ